MPGLCSKIAPDSRRLREPEHLPTPGCPLSPTMADYLSSTPTRDEVERTIDMLEFLFDELHIELNETHTPALYRSANIYCRIAKTKMDINYLKRLLCEMRG
jgi:hypothetical protein